MVGDPARRYRVSRGFVRTRLNARSIHIPQFRWIRRASRAHGWEVDLAYRHLGADQWFVGTDVREAAAPFGQPLFLNIDSLDVSVSYGITGRVQ